MGFHPTKLNFVPSMRMRRHSMFPFACMPLVLLGVVRLVVSSLANVRVHEWYRDVFVATAPCLRMQRVTCILFIVNLSLRGLGADDWFLCCLPTKRIRVASQTHSIQASLLGTLEDFKVPHVNHLASAGNARGSYSLFDGIYYSDNRSNSRANTCNKPRLLEGMHLLDKRSTQALPVALMIHDNSSDRTAFVPATHHSNFCPINFRCWTLGWVDRSASGVHRSARPFCRRCAPVLNWPGRASGAVTLKKLECSKQAYALRTTAKAFAKDVFINQERKLGARRRSDTVLVSTINDADQGSADVAFRTPLAPYEKSKSLGSGGSMVARLKLKGIDGRAPPGVEPAA
ncbi:hypothetical protein JHK85_035578 [Glycine max]|nr:hypothetical protein JHK85_035578 [Glycine max]